MKKSLSPIVALLIVTALIAGTPVVSFAKNKDTETEHKAQKAKYSINYIDTVAPAIANIQVDTDRHKTKIRWTTKEKSSVNVYLSTSTPVVKTASSTIVITKDAKKKNHKVTFKKLTAGTTYYALIESIDANGTITTSEQITFTTKPAKNTPAPAPIVSIRNIDTYVGTSTIRVTWDTIVPATSRVYYSTSTSTATSSAFLDMAALTTRHDMTLSGLSTSTRYYVTVESIDASSTKKTSSTMSLLTR